MEFMLLPAHRGQPENTLSIPRTPYLCRERYDGGPFLTYPTRMGRATSAWDGNKFDFVEHKRLDQINPVDVKEQEIFLQTWLNFGLLAEFIGLNSDSAPSRIAGSEGQLDELYDMLIAHEDATTFVSLKVETLQHLLEMSRSRHSSDPESRKARCQHLTRCLAYAHPMLKSVPKEFNYDVKSSIAALSELLTETLKSVLQNLGLQPMFSPKWSDNFFIEEVQETMVEHGWCPSDISRVNDKYLSMQTLYIARMLDRSLPRRDHSACNQFECKTTQISMRSYEIRHQTKSCTCKILDVSSDELTDILEKPDVFPMIRLVGEGDDLQAEIVESSPDIPYIAISHVWADGLGNPNSNSLHRCQLRRLNEYINEIYQHNQGSAHPAPSPCIWLDTLCCPAKEDERRGKQIAIEKIRLVYKQAAHVLVLDAGLMAYPLQPQDISEQIVRVFTSSWMRRLWTLQEGALAQSLYFRFAETSVSLAALGSSILAMKHSMGHRSVLGDMINEFLGLHGFFSPTDPPKLARLDASLKYRSVSVASDEPLCVGTLMSLNLVDILAVKEPENRMQKVWELLAAKSNGIPAQIIFFEEPRIDADGWRWAPKSFLTYTKSVLDLSGRIIRWTEDKLGTISPHGLQVQYAGWRISTAPVINDARPRNCFTGFERIGESYIDFRCVASGRWYRIVASDLAYKSKTWNSEEERRAHFDMQLFPLHDLANSETSVLITNEPAGRGTVQAVFAECKGHWKEGLRVETKRQVMVHPLQEDNGYIYDVARRLATEFRSHELTDRHLAIYDRLIETSQGVPPVSEESSTDLDQQREHISAELKLNELQISNHNMYNVSKFEGNPGVSAIEATKDENTPLKDMNQHSLQSLGEDRLEEDRLEEDRLEEDRLEEERLEEEGEAATKSSFARETTPMSNSSHEPTSKERLQAILDSSTELQDPMKALKDAMRKRMKRALAEDERFANAVRMFFGESFLESIWVLIFDYFHHDYVGEEIGEEQVWYVD